MRLLPAFACLNLLLSLSSVVFAQTPQTPTTQTPTAVADPTTAPALPDPNKVWQQEYTIAKDKLVAGDFPTAEQSLYHLALRAPSPTHYAVALEQWRLAHEWSKRGLVLVRRSDLGESAIAAKAANQRTADELAVLYTNSVFYGLGTGAWLGVVGDANSAAGFILPGLGIAGGSAGLVALLDHFGPFKYGVPQSIVTGMYLGLNEGITWAFWNQARTRHADEWEGKTVASLIWGMSTAGAITGGIVGTTIGTTPGRASFVGSTSMWTAVVGGLTAGALSADDDSLDDHALLTAAIGLNAGAIAGIAAAGWVSPTIARVRYLDLSGICGGLVTGGIHIASDENVKGPAIMGSTAAGIATGLIIGWIATSGMPQDKLEPETTPQQAWLRSVRFGMAPSQSGALMTLSGAM